MAWVSLIFLLSAAFYNLSEGIHHEKKLTSAVVVGTVYCDTCFGHNTFKHSHPITGASVAVECSSGDSSRASFRQEAKTDEHGEFQVALPFSVDNHVTKIKRCSAMLISSSEPSCAVSSRGVSSSIQLKSRKQGENTFSAGFFSFKPENQPEICNQTPETEDHNSQFRSEKASESSKASIFSDKKRSKNLNFFPPIIPPIVPPILPQPPSLIPPVIPQPPPLLPPILPQPPPLIPPVLPQPPPSPLIPIPPFPGLTPPSPPPPAFPVPLPPLLPSPPPSVPRFPGIPPGSSSSTISSRKPSP